MFVSSAHTEQAIESTGRAARTAFAAAAEIME
jgi:hypothetical protein